MSNFKKGDKVIYLKHFDDGTGEFIDTDIENFVIGHIYTIGEMGMFPTVYVVNNHILHENQIRHIKVIKDTKLARKMYTDILYEKDGYIGV